MPVEIADDFLNVLFAQTVLASVLFIAAAGVNHKDAGSAFGVFLINDDDAGRDASTIEEVGGQAYDTLNPLLFKNLLADGFLGIASEQNAVWHNDTCFAGQTQRFQNMEKPCIVAILFRRNSVVIESFVLII
ncbi:hypothetical protein SDC9_94437 [bioreactor metagenome]|uniref:Uncharacterized protein n=1 Tax=bioreactor metagenome TaxID=1076179 RepID=A0A645AA69_9ZZZZ